ncbi:MAG: disulfide bond formation protein B [Chromatiales bacterium]|jgi:disulfide bond formation protein DsbB|nr:disulfide bond formation protein B [Chromatiales bacterium]
MRPLFALGFITCTSLMAIALYLQHVNGLEPCPLCILQRVAVIALGVIFLIAALHNPRTLGQRVYGLLIMLTATAGAGVAGRHVWLENLPKDRVPTCGPSLDYMLETLPFKRTLELVLRGSGECAEVTWRMLGLSIPSWTLIAFAGFFLFGAYLLFQRKRKSGLRFS